MRAVLTLAALAAVAPTISLARPAQPLTNRATDVNPFLGKDLYVSPVYRDSILAEVDALQAEGETELAEKAAKVANVSTFLWIASTSAVPSISTYLRDAKSIQKKSGKPQLVQLVVYNLPERDCSAKASDGELKLDNAGQARYEAFIKSIYSEIERFPDVAVVLILEPDSIGNTVTNLSVEKCAKAAPAYQQGISFAIATLSRLSNVSIYVDAAHSAWLGWPDNLGPTAQILGKILADAKAINPAATVRGVSSDVSNYNGLGDSQSPFGYDELVYHRNLAPLLEAVGYPAHFITDQGRSGRQDIPRSGGDWCNNKAAGFGPRPTTDTPDPIEDAIVWVKPGGESDGTSDTSAVRYDENCGSATSYIPSPEAGTWSSGYFRLLIENANPAF